MEKKHKELLTANHVFLVDNLMIAELFSHMIQTKLISFNEQNHLQVS